MSWTDIFPVFDDEMFAEFAEQASPTEREEFTSLFQVERVINKTGASHILSLSLFWKPGRLSSPVYPSPSREVLKSPSEFGVEVSKNPWDFYIQPVLDHAPRILSGFPDLAIRIYLAADLSFLVEDLVAVGCEVHLMRHSSICHAPGVAWRLLAFAEVNKLVTVSDIERIGEVGPDIERTRAVGRSNLGLWRVPTAFDRTPGGGLAYRPIAGVHLGGRSGWEVEMLLPAFAWYSAKGFFSRTVELPGCGALGVDWAAWPNYGFEEWFLAVAIYPRIASDGLLTFVPSVAASLLLAVDIEYATWSNPASEMIIYRVDSCCTVPSGDGALLERLPENMSLSAYPELPA